MSQGIRSFKTPSPLKHKGQTFNSSEELKKTSTKTTTSRSNSKTKGINLNLAVSPLSSPNIPTRVSDPTSSNIFSNSSSQLSSLPPLQEDCSNQNYNSNYFNGADPKYDLPLPSTAQLTELDIEDQIRLLALKEMYVVEIKDSMNNLVAKLDRSEKELHTLREIIQRSLYKELNGTSMHSVRHKRQSSNPREEAIASTKNRSRRSFSSSSHPHFSSDQANEAQLNTMQNPSLWSNLSKPLNLIQQFDSMLSHEFEKSLTQTEPVAHQEQTPWDLQYDNSRLSYRKSNDPVANDPMQSPSNSNSNSTVSNSATHLDSSNNEIDEAPQNRAYYSRKSEDMLQTVSTSIWTFVNDVKSNVLSSLADENEPNSKDTNHEAPNSVIEIQSMESGSSINLNRYESLTPSKEIEINNSDCDEIIYSGDETESKIDLSIYSSLRDK